LFVTLQTLIVSYDGQDDDGMGWAWLLLFGMESEIRLGVFVTLFDFEFLRLGSK
jgi:hypothetical protein